MCNLYYIQTNKNTQFFAQDMVVLPVKITIYMGQNLKEVINTKIKKLKFTYVIQIDNGNEDSNSIQKFYRNTCILL